MAEEYTMTTESCELIYLASKIAKSLASNLSIRRVTIDMNQMTMESLARPNQVIFFK